LGYKIFVIKKIFVKDKIREIIMIILITIKQQD